MSRGKHLIWISKGMIRPWPDLLLTNHWSIYDVVCRRIIRFHKQKDLRSQLRFLCCAFVKRSCFSVKAGKEKNYVHIEFGIYGRRQRLLRIPNTAWGFQVTAYVRLLHILTWLPYLSKRALFFYRLMTTRRGHFLDLSVIDCKQLGNDLNLIWIGV